VHDWVPAGEPDRPPCGWHLDGCRVAWPAELAAWAADHEGLDPGGCPGGPASIAWPTAGTVLYVDPRIPAGAQRIPLRAAAPAGAREARWTVDGLPVATVAPTVAALWQPASAGLHTVALEVDGVDAGTLTVEVRGHPEPAPR
jgi:hypothetical protein